MAKTCKHTASSNNPDCIAQFVGGHVVGFLKGELPNGRADLARGTKTLIFDCGCGLTFSSSGSYWAENPEEVNRAIERVKDELRKTRKELGETLRIAGAAVK